MILYTRKGDEGQTSIFGQSEKLSKSSQRVIALGSLDELNSLLGVCKVKSDKKEIFKILEDVQNDLFIIQAEVANAKKSLTSSRITEIEKIIDSIEKRLPKITTFIISGGTELSALLDYSRAVSRRAERIVFALNDKTKINPESLKYLNRLSSLLYALARLANVMHNIKEKKPKY